MNTSISLNYTIYLLLFLFQIAQLAFRSKFLFFQPQAQLAILTCVTLSTHQQVLHQLKIRSAFPIFILDLMLSDFILVYHYYAHHLVLFFLYGMHHLKNLKLLDILSCSGFEYLYPLILNHYHYPYPLHYLFNQGFLHFYFENHHQVYFDCHHYQIYSGKFFIYQLPQEVHPQCHLFVSFLDLLLRLDYIIYQLH